MVSLLEILSFTGKRKKIFNFLFVKNTIKYINYIIINKAILIHFSVFVIEMMYLTTHIRYFLKYEF